MVAKQRTIVLSSIAILAVFALFAWVFMWNDKPEIVKQPELSTTAQPIELGSPADLSGAIPSDVLQQLESRFQKILPTMGETQVLETLQLDRYSKFLSDHHRFEMGGGGYNHKIYVLDSSGYVLEFRDLMGNFPVCILHRPGKLDSKTAQISECVFEMPGWHEYMNPGL